jgi:phosphate starvation-inducible protein PhoH and related proteins
MIKKASEKKQRDKKSLSTSSESITKEISRSDDILSTISLNLKLKNDIQKKLIVSIDKNDVTVCHGPAGTGKSLCSIYSALKLLKEDRNKYKNILLLKSITQLKDEMLPSLPGNAMEKMYFQNLSFIDSFNKLIGKQNTEKLIENGILIFDVIGSMRGRNLCNTIVIVDECQNISHDNMKTILTRLSENSKIIILGDPKQIDIKNKALSCFVRLIRKISSKPINGIEIIEFTKNEIVRHRLTGYFIDLFDEENTPTHTKVIIKESIKNPFKKFYYFLLSKFTNK